MNEPYSLLADGVNEDVILSAIGEGSTDAITRVNAEGQIMAWTPGAERMLGYTRQEILGKPIDLIVPKDIRDSNLFSMKQQLKGELGIIHEETVRLHKNGRHIPVLLTRVPLTNSKGEIVALLTIMKDISEQKKLKREVEHLQRNTAMARVAAKVAHEIRTPLGVLFLKSDMLAEHMQQAFEEWGQGQACKRKAKIEKFVIDIQKQINRLEEIANNYLHLSKSRMMERQSVNLQKFAQDAANELKEQYKDYSVEIQAEVDESVPCVDIDPQQFQRVVCNLVRNSVEAICSSDKKRGSIAIAIGVDRTGVFIEVRDDGPGMPVDIRDNAFDPFSTTKSIGTGLGLYLVQEIVNNHGGSITIQTAEGQGTAVRIYIPLEPEQKRGKRGQQNDFDHR